MEHNENTILLIGREPHRGLFLNSDLTCGFKSRSCETLPAIFFVVLVNYAAGKALMLIGILDFPVPV